VASSVFLRPPGSGLYRPAPTCGIVTRFGVPAASLNGVGTGAAKVCGPDRISGPCSGITEMPSATDRVIPQGISPSFNCLQNDFRREGRGHVRRGERGTMIVKASTSVPQSERERSEGSEEDPRAVPFARASLRNDFTSTSPKRFLHILMDRILVTVRRKVKQPRNMEIPLRRVRPIPRAKNLQGKTKIRI
jgi:hypothetical protein